ncbi:MAG: glycosidase [Glaciecola sp.]
MRLIVYILITAFFFTACMPINTPDTTAKLDLDNIESWYNSAATFFLDDNANPNIVEFAEQLQTVIVGSDTAVTNDWALNDKQKEQSPSLTFASDSIVLLDNAKASNQLPAKIDLLGKHIQLFWAHQVTFSGSVFLSADDQKRVETNEKYKNYIASLSELALRYPTFHKGSIEIYAADNERRLFAFSRVYKNTRVFIAINLSFETHEIPLPFDFMSSTKVLMWESDNIQLREFVTQSAISIASYTSAIMIVGA